MDDRTFDRVARLFGQAASRRQAAAAFVGAFLTGTALAAPKAADPGADTPRRGANREQGKRGGARAGVAGKAGHDRTGKPTGSHRRAGSADPEKRGSKRPHLVGPCGDGSGPDNRCRTDGDCCTGICRKRGNGQTGRCRCNQRDQPCSEDRNCCKTLTCIKHACSANGGGNDSGNWLQNDIDNAPEGAVIDLPAGIFIKDLKITRTVTLRGASSAGLHRAAANATVLMNATPGSRTITVLGVGVMLTLQNLTVTKNGDTATIGGIEVSGGAALTLLGTTQVNGAASGSISGAGIALHQASPSRITDSVIVSDNQSDAAGGGIVVDRAQLTIDGASKIVRNRGGDGGGIALSGTGARLTMGGTASITGNTATSTGGGAWLAADLAESAATLSAANVYGNTAPLCATAFYAATNACLGTSDQTATPTVSPAPTTTATATATPIQTPVPTATPAATATHTPTATLTATPVPTNTPTATPTDTPLPTNTPTATPTDTPLPTNTPTATPTDTPVPTNTPTATPTDTPVPTNTATSTPTDTPVPTNTATSTPTDTPVPTNTPTSTPTDTPVPTNTPTATPTDTPVPTNTATSTPTDTPVPTDTPTATPTDTPVPTNTPTATPTDTPVPTNTATSTPTDTPVPTDTPTATPTDTPVSTNTPTATPTDTPVPTNTPTATPTDTPVPTNTPTATPTDTPVPTNTATSTPTDTPVPTNTPTATPTDTPVPTNTPTATPTDTPVPTNTTTATPIATETPAATYTPTPTATSVPTATITTTMTASEIQTAIQSAWNPALAMPCTATDINGTCTATTYDPTYTAVITVETGSYTLIESATAYPIKLQGTADASLGCGPTCTCPTGEASCDLSAVTGCAAQCYTRTSRDTVVPAKVVIKPFTAGAQPAFSISSGPQVAIAGGPDAKSQVQATFEDLKFSGSNTITGVQGVSNSDTTVRRCRFSTLKYGVDLPSAAVAGSTMTVIDSEFTKSTFAIANQKTGAILRVKTENGRGSQVWGNTRGCVNWGSGHVTFDGPFMCYLQGGSSTAFASSAMGIYTQIANGEGGINVSTATLDSSTGAITSAGTATEGLDPDTGMPYFQIMGTGSSSGTQYLFQYGLFADKTTFIAIRNTAITNLGTGICQNMVTGTSVVKRVTLANTKITNYKTMYYKGTGSAYCAPPDLSATPQIANVNITSTGSPTMFSPSSGICLTTDWKAPTDLSPNYQRPVAPNPYPSDTSGNYAAPGGRCATSSQCQFASASYASCCPATGTQTCSTAGDSSTIIVDGICMCLGQNVRCDADSQCCNGYCHPTEKVCTCGIGGAVCTSNSQCCDGACTNNVCVAAATATPTATATTPPA